MATTVAARRLTQAYRTSQGQIGTATVAKMRAIWPLLKGNDLDGSFDRWLTAAMPIVQGQRTTAAKTAASYLSTFKQLELGTKATRSPIALATDLATNELATSLLVTGPISVKRAMTRGVPLIRALSVAEASSAAAAMRHAIDGGRDTILATTAADSQAVGWERVASGNACAFCQMLAGRGAVYTEDSGDFASHDGCNCSAEPVYRG